MRIGHGYDAHRIIPGEGLVLGGVSIKCNFSLQAYSDALLGAANYGDVGKLFPSKDKRFKDISSRDLLKKVSNKLRLNGYEVQNIDISFVGEEPKLQPYIRQICNNISEDLETDLDRISCKATTTDGLGFEGLKKGISCIAMSLIEEKI